MVVYTYFYTIVVGVTDGSGEGACVLGVESSRIRF